MLREILVWFIGNDVCFGLFVNFSLLVVCYDFRFDDDANDFVLILFIVFGN